MSEDDLRTDVDMVRGAEAIGHGADSGCGGKRGVVVVVVDGGSRFELLCGDPAGKVCLPSASWAKPLTQASASDMLALWEDHGAHVVCPLHHTKALVQ